MWMLTSQVCITNMYVDANFTGMYCQEYSELCDCTGHPNYNPKQHTVLQRVNILFSMASREMLPHHHLVTKLINMAFLLHHQKYSNT
jgi:hypothetical protein